MIRLDIQEYCHECPEFEPKKDTTYRHWPNGKITASDNVVYCTNFIKCHRIARYLKQKLSEEKKDDQS